MTGSFEWNEEKNATNILKHGIDFREAIGAFYDPNHIITEDRKHSTQTERRLYLVGMIDKGIVTVRFVVRGSVIRIYGAGFWRQGKKAYEQNKLHTQQ